MPDQEATYEINKYIVPRGTKCSCGHTIEVHGTNGRICAGCSCKIFVEIFDPKRPTETKIEEKGPMVIGRGHFKGDYY